MCIRCIFIGKLAIRRVQESFYSGCLYTSVDSITCGGVILTVRKPKPSCFSERWTQYPIHRCLRWFRTILKTQRQVFRIPHPPRESEIPGTQRQGFLGKPWHYWITKNTRKNRYGNWLVLHPIHMPGFHNFMSYRSQSDTQCQFYYLYSSRRVFEEANLGLLVSVLNQFAIPHLVMEPNVSPLLRSVRILFSHAIICEYYADWVCTCGPSPIRT